MPLTTILLADDEVVFTTNMPKLMSKGPRALHGGSHSDRSWFNRFRPESNADRCVWLPDEAM